MCCFVTHFKSTFLRGVTTVQAENDLNNQDSDVLVGIHE